MAWYNDYIRSVACMQWHCWTSGRFPKCSSEPFCEFCWSADWNKHNTTHNTAIHSALSVRGRLQRSGTSGITGHTETCWAHTCANTCVVVVLPLETRTFSTLFLLTLLYFGHRLDVANLQVADSLYTLHFTLTLWHLPPVVCLSYCNNKINMKKSKINSGELTDKYLY